MVCGWCTRALARRSCTATHASARPRPLQSHSKTLPLCQFVDGQSLVQRAVCAAGPAPDGGVRDAAAAVLVAWGRAALAGGLGGPAAADGEGEGAGTAPAGSQGRGSRRAPANPAPPPPLDAGAMLDAAEADAAAALAAAAAVAGPEVAARQPVPALACARKGVPSGVVRGA